MKKVLALICLSATILVSGGVALAEITEPYTIDEKDQVLFGDSGIVSGHLGLENYTAEYVGGYLHIAYTYSHIFNNFASFPPILYITAEDPETTATPTVRSEEEVLPLTSGDATDWYAYDIQFNSSGYTVTVLRAGTAAFADTVVTVTGQTDTDYAALANEYTTAPTEYSMAFTPLLIYEEDPPEPDPEPETEAEAGFSRSGDRGRCVETNIGIYCPNEIVREWYTVFLMEQIVVLMQKLIQLLQAQGI